MLAKRSSVSESSERLVARRRRERRRARILFYILGVVFVGAFIWLTWQPYVRITRVSISNEDSTLQALVEQNLAGSYFAIVPRNSFFFVPEHTIRTAIIEMNPTYQAVSVVRNGFTSINISLHERVPVARWCGIQRADPYSELLFDGEYCYLFDPEGYVYAAAEAASSTPTLNSFVVYDNLVGSAEEPLRATLAHARHLPNLFDFARKIGSLGSQVTLITIRDDETDLQLESGTRVTYLLGSEESSFASILSTKPNMNLGDGSLLYVDLRFPGKMYLKKKGASVQ